MKIINRMTRARKGMLVLTAMACAFAFVSFVSFSNNLDAKKNEVVVISTNFGEMVVVLYDETPLHKANFLKLVDEQFYDSLLFHRVISGFMIQGGDPDSKAAAKGAALGRGGPGYTIPAEFNPQFIHKKGALSAARQGDQVNPQKESSGSQFYIVQGKPITSEQLESIEKRAELTYTPSQKEIYQTLGGTPHLDGQYTVFGEVIEGLNVIDSIAAQKTDRRDRPAVDIWMVAKIEKRKLQ